MTLMILDLKDITGWVIVDRGYDKQGMMYLKIQKDGREQIVCAPFLKYTGDKKPVGDVDKPSQQA